jgi:hypothetical protein
VIGKPYGKYEPIAPCSTRPRSTADPSTGNTLQVSRGVPDNTRRSQGLWSTGAAMGAVLPVEFLVEHLPRAVGRLLSDAQYELDQAAARLAALETTYRTPGTKVCSICAAPRDRPGQAYCRACHAADMRSRRPAHRDLTPEAKRRANGRAYTKVLQARGTVPKGPCEACGAAAAQNHHYWGYADPRRFLRLCAGCTRALTARTRPISAAPAGRVS